MKSYFYIALESAGKYVYNFLIGFWSLTLWPEISCPLIPVIPVLGGRVIGDYCGVNFLYLSPIIYARACLYNGFVTFRIGVYFF